MAVEITNKLSPDSETAVLQSIAQITSDTPALTPRSYTRLKKLASLGLVAVAFDSKKVIGWLIAEPLRKNVYELGMAYVHPAYRRSGILKKLIQRLIEKDATQLFATYQPEILSYMMKEHGFSRTTLPGIVLKSKGTFLLKRLSPTIIGKIMRRTAKQKVHYGIRSPET